MKSKPHFQHALRLLSVPLLLLLLLAGLSPALAQRDDPENIEPPDSVTIAGTLQTPWAAPATGTRRAQRRC